LALALLGLVLSVSYLMIADIRWSGQSAEPVREGLIVLAFLVVATAVVHGLVVRRGGTRAGLVLAILGLLSLSMFWIGLPAVLATGAIALALNGRDAAGDWSSLTRTTVGLGVVVLLLALVAAFSDL